jgi:hypothetical protein
MIAHISRHVTNPDNVRQTEGIAKGTQQRLPKNNEKPRSGKQPAADVGRQDTGRLWNMIP